MRTSNYMSHYCKYPKIHRHYSKNLLKWVSLYKYMYHTYLQSLVSAIGSIKNDKGIGDKYGIYGVS